MKKRVNRSKTCTNLISEKTKKYNIIALSNQKSCLGRIQTLPFTGHLENLSKTRKNSMNLRNRRLNRRRETCWRKRSKCSSLSITQRKEVPLHFQVTGLLNQKSYPQGLFKQRKAGLRLPKTSPSIQQSTRRAKDCWVWTISLGLALSIILSMMQVKELRRSKRSKKRLNSLCR